MKGHNYGLCKCGKTHDHGMAGRNHSKETKSKISRAKKGKPSPFKGVRNRMSPEGKARIAEANRQRIWTAEMRAKVSQSLKGRSSPMKGRRLTPLQRLRHSRGVRNSAIHKNAIREYHEDKAKEFLREFYNLPKEAEFVPASPFEHQFARLVLIEEKCDFSFIHVRLREHPSWYAERDQKWIAKHPVMVGLS